MKKISIVVVVFFFGMLLQAQEKYSASLSGVTWVKMESPANLTIKTHTKNELLIEGGKASKTPERAKGLKLAGEGGEDNTNVGFYVIKEGDDLIVRNLRRSQNATIYLPSSQNISVKTTRSGNIKIDGFEGEVEATATLNGGVKMENVSGPLTANTLNGGVSIVFDKVSQKSPITIHSTNGALNISLPSRTPADISLGTINGEIFSNFDLQVPEKNGLKAIGSSKIRGAINNGGVMIQLKTINGDIFLRKQ